MRMCAESSWYKSSISGCLVVVCQLESELLDPESDEALEHSAAGSSQDGSAIPQANKASNRSSDSKSSDVGSNSVWRFGGVALLVRSNSY